VKEFEAVLGKHDKTKALNVLFRRGDWTQFAVIRASREQSSGISQIGEAVSQMDQVTQQNAALVEEIAAAASSLKVQAAELVRQMSQFTVEGGHEVPRLN
jgi:hypothetical protein